MPDSSDDQQCFRTSQRGQEPSPSMTPAERPRVPAGRTGAADEDGGTAEVYGRDEVAPLAVSEEEIEEPGLEGGRVEGGVARTEDGEEPAPPSLVQAVPGMAGRGPDGLTKRAGITFRTSTGDEGWSEYGRGQTHELHPIGEEPGGTVPELQAGRASRDEEGEGVMGEAVRALPHGVVPVVVRTAVVAVGAGKLVVVETGFQ